MNAALVLTEITIIIFILTSRTGVLFEQSKSSQLETVKPDLYFTGIRIKMYALNLFSVWMLSSTTCNKNLNISLSRFKCCNSWSSKCWNREIKDCDAIRGICILELKVLQIIHTNKLGKASNLVFFQIPTPLYWYRVFSPSKQLELVSPLIW